MSDIEVRPVGGQRCTSAATSSLLAILPPYHPPLYNGTHTKMSAPTSHHCSGTGSTLAHQQGARGNIQGLTGAQTCGLWTLAGARSGHMTCHGTPATKYSTPLLSVLIIASCSSSLALTIISAGRPHGDTELAFQRLNAHLFLLPRRRVLQPPLAQTF